MTDLPYLAQRLYGTPLLIARPKLEAILGVMARKMAGEPLAIPPDAALPTGFQILDGIAVLPILGTLVRRASYLHAASGLTSYHEIEAMAEAAFADEAVKAVLLEIDSSGGEAGGVFDLARRLKNLARDTGKPLWAVADEAALSAAYALASAADQLWLTQTAEVGSVGVVAVHVDVSAADAKAGLNYSFLHAGAHKIDGHPHAPLPDRVAADIQADLDRLHDQFIALIAGFRRLTPEAVRATEARIHRGEAAIQAGLADRIGTTREALTFLARSLCGNPAARRRASSKQEFFRMDQDPKPPVAPPVQPDDPSDDPQAKPDLPLDEAAITAEVEARLRRQLAELTAIAAQAKRLGVTVDPAKALARGTTPDAFRQAVLKEAAERDAADDIVAHAPASAKPQSIADSPLVKAAAAYGGRR